MNMEPLKLNLGCGDKPIDGYVNLDAKFGHEVYPFQECYRLSETKSIIIRRGYIDEIRASHIIEHFPCSQTLDIFKHWVSYLKPGGVLKIAVPDFGKLARYYCDGNRANIEGYIMGGQCDCNDFHKALFDKPALIKLMQDAGLVDIVPWQSEIDDCASLLISLNLQGSVPFSTVCADSECQIIDNQSQIQVRVAAVMSVPRLSITNNVACMYRTIAECGITCGPAQGVFWHHGLTRQIEDRIAEGFEVLVAVDFDSWFLPGHVARLIELLMQSPDADAICAVQCEREGSLPIMGLRDDRGEPIFEIPRRFFEQSLTPIQIGHFGLTVFRASAFSKLSRPWFAEEPDPNGSWREGRKDADVAFWYNFQAGGCKLFMANEVSIGHLQEVCTFAGRADDNWRPAHVYPRDLNAGRMPDHCRPETRLKKKSIHFQSKGPNMCALALTGRVNVSIDLANTNVQDLSTPIDPLKITTSRSISSGTGADQGDLLWHDERTLTNGATESLDLHGGTLTGAFGTVTFDKIKGICILNKSTENGLKIGGAAANAVGLFGDTTDVLVLPAASATNKPSVFLMEAPAAAGIDVITNDELKIAHPSDTTNSVIYQIAIWGED